MGGCTQFLSRVPLGPPVSRYGTVGTGVAFIKVYKYGCKQFINMEPLERGFYQFLNREPLGPPVSRYGTVGTGVANSF